MTEVPYDELDPGIRETVRWLNKHLFKTTDSGDGVSKFQDPDNPVMDMAMDFPPRRHLGSSTRPDPGV